MQRTRVTQIQVRVDCNGCVQKIKKALNGIQGIHDIRVDFRKQRLTITGRANPEQIVKAIKKTGKNATICADIELTTPSQPRPAEPEPKGNSSPAPDATEQQSTPEASPPPTENSASQQWQSNPGRKDVREVHVVHHHVPDYVNRHNTWHSYVGYLERYHNSPIFVQEPPQSVHVTHSYNTYMPSHYVTEYEYDVRSSPWHTHCNHIENYGGDYYNDYGAIASIFSDDNPNACTIV